MWWLQCENPNLLSSWPKVMEWILWWAHSSRSVILHPFFPRVAWVHTELSQGAASCWVGAAVCWPSVLQAARGGLGLPPKPQRTMLKTPKEAQWGRSQEVARGGCSWGGQAALTDAAQVGAPRLRLYPPRSWLLPSLLHPVSSKWWESRCMWRLPYFKILHIKKVFFFSFATENLYKSFPAPGQQKNLRTFSV